MLDQIQLMSVFVAVAEEQGFAAASRRLNMSPPTVTRAIATLEERLSVKLFNRTTRYVRATEAGLRYLDDVKRILDDISLANEAVQGINASPQGSISVTAPVLFGQQYVLPSVLEYLNTHPKTNVNAVFLDRIVNMLEEGYDVGVRIGELPDSSMRAKKVGSARLALVASPEYLEKNGIPQHFSELDSHSLIETQVGSLNQDWKFTDNGKLINYHINSRLKVSTNQAAVNAALAGFGITRVISYQVASELQNNKLKFVLESFEQPAFPINIIHREDRLSSAKVRSFIDLLALNLSKQTAFN
ncbi:LysR family transcriptional regulator [Algibacillus agarilyticus]|uniref:LysR family transcriptional regulator n=1 Tax=Algibacillus agarilyticus TaxID=2234133 RepID=UPI0018E50160|nr:LysR family transcriptional regulator [Algibacillus agarilyticus]